MSCLYAVSQPIGHRSRICDLSRALRRPRGRRSAFDIHLFLERVRPGNWHCTEEEIVSPYMARTVADAIPTAEVHFGEGLGHQLSPEVTRAALRWAVTMDAATVKH